MKQAGFSLVSLMIGLLISMLCLLGCMSLQKSLVQVTLEARSDASHDSGLITALMQLERDLYGAGFGIEGADLDDVVVDSSGARLLWRSVEDGALVCRGVEDVLVTISDEANRRELVRLRASGCNTTSDLSTLSWTPEQTPLARFINPAQTATPPAVFNFAVAVANCAPYGLGVQQEHVQIAVSPLTSVARHNSGTSSSYEFCLPNTYI